jgi:anaerobic dimethyl sulfoxide reductase subunit B (iron-sulfur subunit)
MRALSLDDIAALRKKLGTIAEVAPLPDASYTQPNLVIRPGMAARRSNSTDGFIANPTEVK